MIIIQTPQGLLTIPELLNRYPDTPFLQEVVEAYETQITEWKKQLTELNKGFKKAKLDILEENLEEVYSGLSKLEDILADTENSEISPEDMVETLKSDIKECVAGFRETGEHIKSKCCDLECFLRDDFTLE